MKTVFTTGEAAKICKVSQQTIIRCFDSGQLKGFRVPGSRFRRIPREALYRFMKENGIPTDALESGRRRILIVDDDQGVVDLISEVLAGDARFETRVVNNGFGAGMLAKEYHPDLIILDVMLPDINGKAVCELVKNDPTMSDIKIICISGMVEEEKIDELREAGADDFLHKPLDIDELIRRTCRLLDIETGPDRLSAGPASPRSRMRDNALGKEPGAVRTDPQPPSDLRRRIDRLEGLPLRPSTARLLLAHPCPTASPRGSWTPTPRWALARLLGPVDPLALVADRPWWPRPSKAASLGPRPPLAARRRRLVRGQEAGRRGGPGRPGLRVKGRALAHARILGDRRGRPRTAGGIAGRRRSPRPPRAGASPAGRRCGDARARPGRTLGGRPGPDRRRLARTASSGASSPTCAEAPALLATTRRARAWADRTPWALDARRGRRGRPTRASAS